MINFSCDLSGKTTELKHVWEHTLGSGHAPLALRADWQRQLKKCHDGLGTRYVRFHGLLSDDMGTLICQDEKLLYSFFNADRIIDFLLSIGMRPFVELSFMPRALSSGSETVFHYQANVTPPRDYEQWAALIAKLVKHWVDSYGIDEVRKWYFEVWNEPNLDAFWKGGQKDYFDLYRYTVEAIKEADDQIRVGGPATAQNAWVSEFLEFCREKDLPADFISTHYYPTDALGKTDTDTETQLAEAPHNVMRKRAIETRKSSNGLPVYYTEWSISSNPRDHYHDEPFAASLITNILMHVDSFVDGYSYWTFTDIFEENYFPSRPFHGGFGLLNLYGIPKPAYRAVELLHNLGDELLNVKGEHKTISAWAIKNNHKATLLLTNHAMPHHEIETGLVKFGLSTARRPQTVYIERIDNEHANPKRVWQDIGEPEYLSHKDAQQIQAASCLAKEPQPFEFEHGEIELKLSLPPHSVAAVTLEFAEG